MQPKCFSNARISSTGIAAPPDTHTRRLATSPAPPAALCKMAAYIVGTPARTVTSSLLMISSARTGSNLGSRVRHAPEAMAHQVEGHFARLELRVHRDHDGTSAQDAVIKLDELRCVRCHQADPVAGRDPAPEQPGRHPGTPFVQLAVAHRAFV